VFNLVRNSIEAMQVIDARSRALRILSRRQGDDRIEIEVRDCGPGISDPDKIFDAFYTTKSDGMGMGLAICRSIVETHGGRVSASNLSMGGAAIIVSLPIRTNDAAVAEDLRMTQSRVRARATSASGDGA
jgi:signal transduction histidine kinase